MKNPCDGNGSSVTVKYTGGDGRCVVKCRICKRKFVVRARNGGGGEDDVYGNIPPHNYVKRTGVAP